MSGYKLKRESIADRKTVKLQQIIQRMYLVPTHKTQKLWFAWFAQTKSSLL